VESVFARVRVREVSAAGFLRIALASVLSLYIVVTTGAVVRLTASGLGCDHWPKCGSTPFPEKGGHAFIEFGNRVISLGAIIVSLLVWLAARRVRGLSAGARRGALLVFLGTAAQIPLILPLPKIFIDIVHSFVYVVAFLLALAALGGAVAVAFEGWRLYSGGAAGLGSSWWRWAALAGLPACVVLVVSGAVVSASGPHSGGTDIRRLGIGIVDAVYVHVRIVAVFGIGFLLIGSWLARHRREVPGVALIAAALLAVLVVQGILGEVQYRTHLPWWLVLIHVSFGAAIWALTVALVYAIWRPPAALVRQ